MLDFDARTRRLQQLADGLRAEANTFYAKAGDTLFDFQKVSCIVALNSAAAHLTVRASASSRQPANLARQGPVWTAKRLRKFAFKARLAKHRCVVRLCMPTVVVQVRSRGVLLKVLIRRQLQPGERSAMQPPAEPVMAYLDTGASNTVFDQDFLATLGLRSTRNTALHVLGRDGVSFHDAFDVDIAVVASDQELHWQPLTVLAGPVFQTGAVAALGRDFLRTVTFTYDGPRQRVQLCW